MADFPMKQTAIYGPLKHVHLDLAGPFLTSSNDVEGRLLAAPYKLGDVLTVDYFIKAAEFASVPGKQPTDIAKAYFDLWIIRYDLPIHVTTNIGTDFSLEFAYMLTRLGVHHVHSSAYHAASNGVVERLVKSFQNILTAHADDYPNAWIRSIPHVCSAYVVHSSSRVSPKEMLMGFPNCMPLPSICSADLNRQSSSPYDSMECSDPQQHIFDLQAKLSDLYLMRLL